MEEIEMPVLKAADMHCEKCVARIEKALGEAGLDFQVNLSEQTVTINGCAHCVAKAKELMDDLGFETVEV